MAKEVAHTGPTGSARGSKLIEKGPAPGNHSQPKGKPILSTGEKSHGDVNHNCGYVRSAHHADHFGKK
jgi:hypothetical protein